MTVRRVPVMRHCDACGKLHAKECAPRCTQCGSFGVAPFKGLCINCVNAIEAAKEKVRCRNCRRVRFLTADGICNACLIHDAPTSLAPIFNRNATTQSITMRGFRL